MSRPSSTPRRRPVSVFTPRQTDLNQTSKSYNLVNRQSLTPTRYPTSARNHDRQLRLRSENEGGSVGKISVPIANLESRQSVKQFSINFAKSMDFVRGKYFESQSNVKTISTENEVNRMQLSRSSVRRSSSLRRQSEPRVPDLLVPGGAMMVHSKTIMDPVSFSARGASSARLTVDYRRLSVNIDDVTRVRDPLNESRYYNNNNNVWNNSVTSQLHVEGDDWKRISQPKQLCERKSRAPVESSSVKGRQL